MNNYCEYCGVIAGRFQTIRHKPSCPEKLYPCSSCPIEPCPGPCERYDNFLRRCREAAEAAKVKK